MLTTVYLDGELGRKFGKEWSLNVGSSAEALRLINANVDGFAYWIRDSAKRYDGYHVVCTYQDGTVTTLDEDDFKMQQSAPLKSIRFVPAIRGSGGGGGLFQAIIGVALMVSAIWLGPKAFMMGLAMFAGGVAQMLSPQPKTSESQKYESHYFNGPESSTRQGNPIKLVYGTCRVGAMPVSATMDIDQLLK